MIHLTHVQCEECCSKTDEADSEIELTDSLAGRLCCYCGRPVVWSVLIHRHPDAVPCQGVHEKL